MKRPRRPEVFHPHRQEEVETLLGPQRAIIRLSARHLDFAARRRDASNSTARWLNCLAIDDSKSLLLQHLVMAILVEYCMMGATAEDCKPSGSRLAAAPPPTPGPTRSLRRTVRPGVQGDYT